MIEVVKQRSELLVQLTRDGYFGEKAKGYAASVSHISPGVPFALEMIQDLYAPKTEDEKSIHGIVNLIVQLLIITYRDAKRADSDVAKAFYMSLVEDFPKVPKTNLYSTFETAVKSSYAHQGAIASKDAIAIEQTALKLVEAYNEFLSSLYGPMLACLRVVHGLPVSKNLFKKKYAERLAEVNELTGGEDGAYYVFGRISRPLMRNAVAHGTIWYDRPNEVFRFPDNQGVLQEIGLVEFMALALVGSRLPHSYVIAICVIQVMEEGNERDIARVPSHLVHAFRHVPS